MSTNTSLWDNSSAPCCSCHCTSGTCPPGSCRSRSLGTACSRVHLCPRADSSHLVSAGRSWASWMLRALWRRSQSAWMLWSCTVLCTRVVRWLRWWCNRICLPWSRSQNNKDVRRNTEHRLVLFPRRWLVVVQRQGSSKLIPADQTWW